MLLVSCSQFFSLLIIRIKQSLVSPVHPFAVSKNISLLIVSSYEWLFTADGALLPPPPKLLHHAAPASLTHLLLDRIGHLLRQHFDFRHGLVHPSSAAAARCRHDVFCLLVFKGFVFCIQRNVNIFIS